jgi:hypothetical protein
MFKLSRIKPFLVHAVISCIHFLFKTINWNHFRMKAHNGKPYYKQIVKIKGFRTAVVDRYDGARTTNRFCWTIGKYNL